MDFKQAKDKLKVIAAGRYHSVNYDITEDSSGEISQQCTLYIDGLTHYTGGSWDEVFSKLEYSVAPVREIEIDPVEEIPVVKAI